jgi:hypothetical protein
VQSAADLITGRWAPVDLTKSVTEQCDRLILEHTKFARGLKCSE